MSVLVELFEASEENCFEKVEELVQNGAKVNTKDKVFPSVKHKEIRIYNFYNGLWV